MVIVSNQKRDYIDGKGDIPELIEKFKNREISSNSILVSFNKIKENDYSLSMSKYRTAEHREVTQEKPMDLMKKVIVLEEEILQDLKELTSRIQ